MKKNLCVLGLLIVLSSSVGAEDILRKPEITVETLSIPVSVLGPGWNAMGKTVLNQEKDLREFFFGKKSDPEKDGASVKEMGVLAVAYYMFVGPPPPGGDSIADGVDVRVYQFATPDKAKAWRDKNLQHEKWTEEYTLVKGLPYFAVDGKKKKERTAVIGSFAINAINPYNYDTHVKVVAHIAQQIPVPKEDKRKDEGANP